MEGLHDGNQTLSYSSTLNKTDGPKGRRQELCKHEDIVLSGYRRGFNVASDPGWRRHCVWRHVNPTCLGCRDSVCKDWSLSDAGTLMLEDMSVVLEEINASLQKSHIVLQK